MGLTVFLFLKEKEKKTHNDRALLSSKHQQETFTS